MMKSTLLSLSLLCALPLAGCGGDDNGMSAGAHMNNNNQTATCRASIKPAVIDYVVTGNTLEFVGAQPLKLTRVQAGTSTGKPVFGIWNLPVTADPAAAALGLSIVATFEIEADHVTVTSACAQAGRAKTATVTSKATVTDQTIATTDTKEDLQTF